MRQCGFEALAFTFGTEYHHKMESGVFDVENSKHDLPPGTAGNRNLSPIANTESRPIFFIHVSRVVLISMTLMLTSCDHANKQSGVARELASLEPRVMRLVKDPRLSHWQLLSLELVSRSGLKKLLFVPSNKNKEHFFLTACFKAECFEGDISFNNRESFGQLRTSVSGPLIPPQLASEVEGLARKLHQDGLIAFERVTDGKIVFLETEPGVQVVVLGHDGVQGIREGFDRDVVKGSDYRGDRVFKVNENLYVKTYRR